MDNIIVKWSSGEYEVDSDRTIEKYKKLINTFLGSELFAVNPFETSDEKLNIILDRRANGEGGYSWIENANKFYSRCHLERVVHISGSFPWEQLCFQPWQSFPVVTMNRFKQEGLVLLDNERVTLPIVKKYEVLGSRDDTTRIEYFNHNIGNDFVYCYRFSIIDDYKARWCLRFAEEPFKREALLLTQFFCIQFLINHPFECFPMPYISGSQGGIHDLNAMATLLNPVIEEKNDTMLWLRDRIYENVVSHDLRAEAI